MIFVPLQAKYFGKKHPQKVNNQTAKNKTNNPTNKVIKWALNKNKAIRNSMKSNNNHKKIHKNSNSLKNPNNLHKELKDKDKIQDVSIINVSC